MGSPLLPDSNTVESSIRHTLDPLGVPVFHGRLPDKPDDAVFIGIYLDDRHNDTSPTISFQVRGRTAGQDPRTTNTLMDNTFGLLHNISNTTWGDTRVLLCRRTIRAPLGADTNGRYERADSYQLILNPR